jgi:hypothetical protein
MGMPVAPAYTFNGFRARTNVTDPSGVNTAFDAGDTALNTNWTQTVDELIRWRGVIQQTVAGATAHADLITNFVLQYNNGGAGWNNVGAVGADVEDVQFIAATGFADGDNTTQVIGSGSFVTGDSMENDTPSDDVSFTDSATSETELEVAVEVVGANVTDADTIEFRWLYSAADESPPATAVTQGANVPTITVDKPATATTDAAEFSNTSTDRVVLVPPGELNTMTSGTWLMWVKTPQAWSSTEKYVQWGDSGDRAGIVENTAVSGSISWRWFRATTSTFVRNATPTFSLATWYFWAVTFDTSGADGDQHFYWGDETTAVAEVTTYTTQQAGSGAITGHSSNFYWGNADPAATASSLDAGAIALEAWYPGVILTSTQLNTERTAPDPTRVAGCMQFAAMQPDGTIIDYITGNIATQTGTAQIDGPLNVTFPTPPFAALTPMRGILDVA